MPSDSPPLTTPWQRAALLGGKIRYGETFGASEAGPSRYTEVVSLEHGCSRMHGHVSEQEFAITLDAVRMATK